MKSDSLWKPCRSCDEQVPVNARSCPHCEAKQYRFRALKWVGGGFVALVVASIALSPNGSDSQASKSVSEQAVTAKLADIPIPEAQANFIAAISDYRARFNSESNELKQAALRDQRRASILAVLGSRMNVKEWVGTLRKLETSGDGKAIITVRVAPELDIETAGSSLSDLAYSTIIEKSSPVYASLMTMKTGDKVRFSGSFIYAEADGFAENSLTTTGAMTAPEFLFQFTSISKQ